MLDFTPLDGKDAVAVNEMSHLATDIVREHFDPLIGKAQNDYMLARFQTPQAIEEQTAQSLDNTAAILTEAGYTFEDVVKTTVLLDDMNNFAAMNGVYARYYTKDMPARVCYQVAKLPMGVKVEIDTIAVKK